MCVLVRMEQICPENLFCEFWRHTGGYVRGDNNIMMEKHPLCEEQTGEQPSQDAMILFGETPALSATVDSNEESPIEATISCRRGKVLLFLFFGSVETNHDEASKMPLIQKISNRVNGYHWNTQRGILGHSLKTLRQSFKDAP